MTHFQGVAGWTFGYSSPYVLTIHGINEKDALFSRGRLRFLRYKVVGLVERLGRKKADNIILISRYVEKEIGEQLMGKCWPIENPVSDDFYEVELGSTAPTILYAGHVKSQKNVDNLIRAFKGVHAEIPSATLRIAGPLDDQKFVNKCRKLVNDLELDTAVQFLGNLSRSALLIELSQAACLALVSHQENAPMVIEEAMAAGVPVVASRICGIPYMIQDGKTGFLVDQNDNDDITDRLIKVLLESVTSCAMSEQSREVALSRFHVQAVAKKTVETYRAIVGDGVWKEGMKNVQNL
ncbi:hypothetical protein A9Q89_04765 [Gammaproteobacteria bacterium 53_120_T64]|nr:hypothetical protein A9Q89_04765 [Gammaproteobacteria bacterium 53_120_T64]